MLPAPLRLMHKGDWPDSKQLIFEKKFPKSKKKIQSPGLVTFNAKISDLSMPVDYFFGFLIYPPFTTC